MIWYVGDSMNIEHDDVIKWKHFPRYWPFVRGIHRSALNSPHKGHWRGALMFSLICAWTNRWVNNREVGDLRRQQAHYDVSVMNRAVWRERLNADAIHVMCKIQMPQGFLLHTVWHAIFFTPTSYRQVSNIRRPKSQHLKDSRTVLRLSLPNPLRPDVWSRMKM